jgi:hypothetical protein
MNRWLLIVASALVMACANGCIVIDTEKVAVCGSTQAEPEEVTIREIDAVGKLSVEENRQTAYKRIAERRCLCAGAQTHLVEAAFQNLESEDARFDVLLALVRNRCFSASAKAALLERLDGLDTEDHRREILDAMSHHRG